MLNINCSQVLCSGQKLFPTLEQESIQQATNLCPFLTHLPQKELYVRYDEEADVLYLQFQRSANIYISKIRDDGIIIEYDNADNIVGLTILEASTRSMI